LDIRNFWLGLGHGARAGLVCGVFAIAAATAGLGWWALRTDYQVLFSELAPQDAAAMTTELDRLKLPYRLGDEGTSILVDKEQVYATRMKLMGKDFPLRGAVGFELFNNSDFGMTEFAQKINYQRALQGELTRTVLSLAQIKDARVLLVLPEQGLFKQGASKAKASITVAMKPGQALRGEQVTGIQRLVSASVPGIAAQDVTILDQNGLALSRNAAADGEGDAGSGRLDLKKEIENYLSRKAGEVLERTFGPGQAMATVDVVLNGERAQVTTEDLVVPPARNGQVTGVVVRERETLRETGAPLETRAADGSASGRSGTSQREVEYAVGRRVEQVVSQPGSIRRLQAVAIVRHALDPVQQEQIRRVVAASVGASFERGDTVVVHTLGSAGATVPGGPADAAAVLGDAAPVQYRAVRRAARTAEAAEPAVQPWMAAGFVAALAAVAVLLLLFGRRKPRGAATAEEAPLSPAQRDVALAKVRAWMAADPAQEPR
jgi:flagellar M-ring protein FliF